MDDPFGTYFATSSTTSDQHCLQAPERLQTPTDNSNDLKTADTDQHLLETDVLDYGLECRATEQSTDEYNYDRSAISIFIVVWAYRN